MDICLDTNVFSSDPYFFIWMDKNNVKGYLPSHAFMELSYYEMRRVGGSMINFMNTLNGLGIEIVPFERNLALVAAKNALIKYDLSNHAVDYAIGAYAYKRKIPFITNNKKHFQWLSEVYTPAEFMKTH
jgi:predicted nucleic acid-binding protein